MFFEGLNNDHGRTARFADVGACGWIIVSGIGFCFWRIDTVIEAFMAEELPQFLHLLDTNVIGEQSVVTNAMKASRQYVDEKAAHELAGGQGQCLVSITPFGTIVFPLECDTAFIAGDEPAVADGDPMGISSEIREHRFRPGERTLGIDHPVDLA